MSKNKTANLKLPDSLFAFCRPNNIFILGFAGSFSVGALMTISVRTSGIRVTNQGQLLRQELRLMEAHLEPSLNNIKNKTNIFEGDVRIGGHQSLIQDYFLPIYPILLQEYPKLNIHIETKSSREIQTDILSNKIDLALLINPIENKNLVIRNLTTTHGYFYCSNKNPKRYFLNPQMIQLQKFLKLIQKNEKWEKEIHFISDYDLISQLVKQGHGCGLLPDHIGARYDLNLFEELSKLYHINYNLKLVMNSEILSDRKKELFRRIESLIRKTI